MFSCISNKSNELFTQLFNVYPIIHTKIIIIIKIIFLLLHFPHTVCLAHKQATGHSIGLCGVFPFGSDKHFLGTPCLQCISYTRKASNSLQPREFKVLHTSFL